MSEKRPQPGDRLKVEIICNSMSLARFLARNKPYRQLSIGPISVRIRKRKRAEAREGEVT